MVRATVVLRAVPPTNMDAKETKLSKFLDKAILCPRIATSSWGGKGKGEGGRNRRTGEQEKEKTFAQYKQI